MADKSQQTEGDVDKLDFIGMDEVTALYADSFLVASAADMFTIYFFQNQIPPVREAASRVQ